MRIFMESTKKNRDGKFIYYRKTQKPITKN